MIILYKDIETDFSHNGEGILNECISCIVHRELNGIWEVNIEYPLSDSKGMYKRIKENYILNIPTPSGMQLFRIQEIETTLDTISVYATHIFFDLAKNFIKDINIVGKTRGEAIKYLLKNTMVSHRFKYVGTDSTEQKNCRIVRKNVVNALLSTDDNCILQRFGGEIDIDNFNIYSAEQIGEDNGLTVAYGKNMTGITETIDMSNVATRIIPQGYNELLLPEYYIDSPYINSYYQPLISHMEFLDIKVINEDEAEDGEVPVTENEALEQLRVAVKKLYSENKIDLPTATYVISFMDLGKTRQYKKYKNLNKLNIGDVVTVKHKDMKLNLSCRIQEYNYDALVLEFEDLTVGTQKKSLALEMKNVQATVNMANEKISLEVNSVNNKFNSKLELTAKNISAEVNDVDKKLSSKIEVNANQIKTKVGSSDVKTIITQSATEVKTAFNNGSDYVSLLANGIKTVHSDGSYSMLGKDGIKHYNGSSGNTYHYLMTTGSAAVGGNLSSTVTITLPAEFKNKDFTVTLSMKSTRYTPQVYGDTVSGIYLNLESIDKTKGTFKVKGDWTSYSIQTAIEAARELEFTYIAIA